MTWKGDRFVCNLSGNLYPVVSFLSYWRVGWGFHEFITSEPDRRSRNTCRSAHIVNNIPTGRPRNGCYITGKAKRISSLRIVQCYSVKLQPPDQCVPNYFRQKLSGRGVRPNVCLYLVPGLKVGYGMPSFPHTLCDRIKLIIEPTFTLLHTRTVSFSGFGRCIPFLPSPCPPLYALLSRKRYRPRHTCDLLTNIEPLLEI